MSPEPFDIGAKVSPAKRSEKGYGDENERNIVRVNHDNTSNNNNNNNNNSISISNCYFWGTLAEATNTEPRSGPGYSYSVFFK